VWWLTFSFVILTGKKKKYYGYNNTRAKKKNKMVKAAKDFENYEEFKQRAVAKGKWIDSVTRLQKLNEDQREQFFKNLYENREQLSAGEKISANALAKKVANNKKLYVQIMGEEKKAESKAGGAEGKQEKSDEESGYDTADDEKPTVKPMAKNPTAEKKQVAPSKKPAAATEQEESKGDEPDDMDEMQRRQEAKEREERILDQMEQLQDENRRREMQRQEDRQKDRAENERMARSMAEDIVSSMFVQLEAKWAQQQTARPVSTDITKDENDNTVAEGADHIHDDVGNEVQDEHDVPEDVQITMEAMVNVLAEDGFNGQKDGAEKALGGQGLEEEKEDDTPKTPIDTDDDDDDAPTPPMSPRTGETFYDSRIRTMETPQDFGMSPPNFNEEVAEDLSNNDRARLIKQIGLAYQVNEDVAEFYVEMWQGGMRFSKDGNFFVSPDGSYRLDLNKNPTLQTIAIAKGRFGKENNEPVQTSSELFKKIGAVPFDPANRPYSGTIPELVDDAPASSSGGAGSGAPPPPAGGADSSTPAPAPTRIPHSIVGGVLAPRTPSGGGGGDDDEAVAVGGVGAGVGVGSQDPPPDEDISGDGSVYDIATYISGGKPTARGTGSSVGKGAKNTQMEMNHRLKASAKQLMNEMKCMHQVFDPLIPEMRDKKHVQEMQSAMQSGDINAIRMQHAKMQAMVAAYYGQASLMKVGLIIDADSYVRAFGSLIGGSGSGGGGGAGDKQVNHSEVDKYGRTRFKSKSKKEHVNRGGINTRRVIENRVPRVIPNTNIPTRAPLFKPRTDVVRPDIPRRFANPYTGIVLKVKGQ
jgi:hypothetical protein